MTKLITQDNTVSKSRGIESFTKSLNNEVQKERKTLKCVLFPPSPSSCWVLDYDCWSSAGSGFDYDSCHQEAVSEEESFILRDPNCIGGLEPSEASGY